MSEMFTMGRGKDVPSYQNSTRIVTIIYIFYGHMRTEAEIKNKKVKRFSQ